MKMMMNLAWMVSGVGVGVLYKSYEKDISKFMRREKKMIKSNMNRMMK